MDKQCIFSGSTDNLNTSMKVRLEDGSTVEVWISDEYAESATPAKVREAYLKSHQKRVDELKELQEKAKALGLVLVPEEKLAVVQPVAEPVVKPAPPPRAPVQAPKPAQTITEDIKPEVGFKVVDGKVADSKGIAPSVQGSVSALGSAVSGAGSEYSITSQEKPSQDLKAGEIAEIGFIKGRAGLDVAVPVRRVGKTGETRVTVVDTGGDRALQERFKRLKESGDSSNGPHDFIRGGYQVRTASCGLCRGIGKIANGKKTCPKCGGSGIIDI